MPNTDNYPLIRRQIKKQMEDGVGDDLGQVHEHIRSSKYWEQHLARIVKNKAVNVWEITTSGTTPEKNRLNDDGLSSAGYDMVVYTHHVRVLGRYGLQDTDTKGRVPSDMIFRDIVSRIIAVFNPYPNCVLGGLLYLPTVAVLSDISHTVWGNILVHYCVIEMECKERVQTGL